MPLKILFITHSNNEEGSITTPGISDQLTEMEKMGLQIVIWKVCINSKSSYLKTALRAFFLNFQPKQYDLVHATYSLNGLIARVQFKSPVVVTLVGSDLMSKEPFYKQGGRDTLIGKMLTRVVDRIIVQTTEMADAIPWRKDIVHTIPFGINTDIFKPAPLEIARQELGLPLDEKCILFPYNPEREEKGFPLVEQAVDILKKEERVRLVIVFGQSRQNLAKYMNACDVLVLASSYEGSPVAVREALACNLPVVSVNVGDVAKYISGIDGCFLCERNAADIADKLRLVIRNGKRVDSRELKSAMDARWSAGEVLNIYKILIER